MNLACRLAALLAACVGASIGAQVPGVLTIEFPAAVSPATVSIFHQGSPFTASATRPATRTHTIPVSGAGHLRVLIYVPGYQLVAREFEDAEMTGTFIPTLIPLSTTTLHGRLVTSSRQPIRDQPMHLKYDLIEAMEFFHYIDGPAPVLELESTRTGDDGGFDFHVPLFINDPFFQRYSPPNSQHFRLASSESRVWWDVTLRPFAFGLQVAFPRPFEVVKTLRGTLAGRLGPAFLQSHDLPLDLGPHLDGLMDRPMNLYLDAAPTSDAVDGPRVISYNAMLKADGTFGVDLPPGLYDLTLKVLGSGGILQRRVVVGQGVQLIEGGRSVIERP